MLSSFHVSLVGQKCLVWMALWLSAGLAFAQTTSNICLIPLRHASGGMVIDGQGKVLLKGLSYRLSEPQGKLMAVNDKKEAEHTPMQSMEGYGSLFKGGKCGLLNLQGQVVMPLQYKAVGYLGEGFFWVANSVDGYSECLPGTPNEGEGCQYTVVGSNGSKNAVAYEDLYFRFIGGLLPVRQNGKWGALNTSGQLSVPCEFEQVLVDSRTHQAFWMRKEGKWYAPQVNGQLKMLAWPSDLRSPQLIGSNGLLVMGHEPDRFWELTPDLTTDIRGVQGWKIGAHNQLYTLSEWRDSLFKTKGLKILQQNGMQALGNAAGKALTSFQQQEFMLAPAGLVKQVVRLEQDKLYGGWFNQAHELRYGLLNQQGKTIVPPEYAYVDVYAGSGRIAAELDSNITLYDLEGRVIPSKNLKAVLNMSGAALQAYRADSQYVLLDFEGKVLWESEEEVVLYGSDGNWLWHLTPEGYYLRSLKGTEVWGPLATLAGSSARIANLLRAKPDYACEGCAIDSIGPDLWMVGAAEEVGVVNQAGEEIYPMAYLSISPTEHAGLFKLETVSGTGLGNLNGDILIPPIYGELRLLECGRVIGIKEEGVHVFDLKGNKVWGD